MTTHNQPPAPDCVDLAAQFPALQIGHDRDVPGPAGQFIKCRFGRIRPAGESRLSVVADSPTVRRRLLSMHCCKPNNAFGDVIEFELADAPDVFAVVQPFKSRPTDGRAA